MSDIFNKPANKQKISQFLQRANMTKGDNPLLEPIIPPVGKSVITNSSQAAKFCLENNIILRKARPIKVMKDYSVSAFYGEESWYPLLSEQILNDGIKLPVGPLSVYPSYRPHHFDGDYDSVLYKQFLYYLLEAEDPSSLTMSCFLEYKKTIETTRYGTGTTDGQLSRLKAMFDVRYGRNGKATPKTLTELKLTLEQAALLLEGTLPITTAGSEHSLFVNLSDQIGVVYNNEDEDDEIDSKLPSFNNTSLAGTPFKQGTKKGDVLLSAVAIGDNFLADMHAVLDGSLDLHAFYKKYFYLGMGLMFPKAEVYEIAKWTTKTRNIWSASFPLHLMMSSLSDPIISKSVINVTNFETPSLQKFSPFYGGLDTFLTKCTRPGHHYFIYADNIYFSYYNEETKTHDYYSVDLEKGEANTTPSDVQLIAYYLLTRGMVDRNGFPQFDAVWAYSCLNIFPAFVCDNTSLLFNLQIKTPGQGSGNSWTFLINHWLSTKFIMMWNRFEKPRPGSEKFMELQFKCGVNLKVEYYLENLEKAMSDVISMTKDQGWMQNNEPDKYPEDTLPELKLDLLGFSAVYSHANKMFIPILDRTRLFQSASFSKGRIDNKTRMEVTNPQGRVNAYTYDIVRYESLLISGGWTIPPLAKALSRMADVRRESLSRIGLDLTKILSNWTSRSEILANMGIEPSEVSVAVPTTSNDIFNINIRKIHPLPHISTSLDFIKATKESVEFGQLWSALAKQQRSVDSNINTLRNLIVTKYVVSTLLLTPLIEIDEKVVDLQNTLELINHDTRWAEIQEREENGEEVDIDQLQKELFEVSPLIDDINKKMKDLNKAFKNFAPLALQETIDMRHVFQPLEDVKADTIVSEKVEKVKNADEASNPFKSFSIHYGKGKSFNKPDFVEEAPQTPNAIKMRKRREKIKEIKEYIRKI